MTSSEAQRWWWRGRYVWTWLNFTERKKLTLPPSLTLYWAVYFAQFYLFMFDSPLETVSLCVMYPHNHHQVNWGIFRYLNLYIVSNVPVGTSTVTSDHDKFTRNREHGQDYCGYRSISLCTHGCLVFPRYTIYTVGAIPVGSTNKLLLQ